MTNAITSPEPTQGEPHPAVRLAEAVCALIAAIAGPSWFWRFLPGGRAFWPQMHRMGQDFAALMHRLAAAPPAPPVTPANHPPRRRRSARTGEIRPPHTASPRKPRRPPTAGSPASRPAAAPRGPGRAQSPASAHPMPDLGPVSRKQRRRTGTLSARENCAYFVTISY